MRWVTYRPRAGAPAAVGVLDADEVIPVPGIASLPQLLERGPETMRIAGEKVLASRAGAGPVDESLLLAPIPQPPSIRDSLSFEHHARVAARVAGESLNPQFLERPLVYFSNPHAATGPFDDVPIPAGVSAFDFELEVAAVIGRSGRDLSAAEAENCIAGYTIMNDWSARDIQAYEMPAGLGPVKSKDSCTTLGPALVTPDELEAVRSGGRHRLEMVVSVNGSEYGRDVLSNMRWSFGELVAFCSRGAWIRPGDVIGSGTCAFGCIAELALVHGSSSYPWLRAGDVVTMEVTGLGRIANRVVAGPAEPPPWTAEGTSALSPDRPHGDGPEQMVSAGLAGRASPDGRTQM